MHFALRLAPRPSRHALCCGPCSDRAQAQEKRFTHAGVASDAKRYETYLKANWQPKGNARELRAEGDKVLAAGNDPRAAARAYAQAVVFDANDVDVLDRARPRAAGHQARPGQRALRAARQCFGRRLDRLRARTDAGRQGRRALVVLARGAEAPLLLAPGHRRAESQPHPRRRRARCARPTTRWWPSTASASSSTRSRPTRPCRACASSSPSAWRSGQVDWSQYFKVDGKDPQSVTAEARQICLDGLAHGRRYEVQVREGLALGHRREAGEDGGACRLRRRTARRPCAPRGAATCCPTAASRASRSSPSTPTRSSVEVYRIGDRSLAQTLQSGDFAKQISSYDIDALKERTGARSMPASWRWRRASTRT